MATTTYPRSTARARRFDAMAAGGFLAALALLLLAVVDIRRGFLFPLSEYHKIGAPSTLLYLEPRHVLLLGIALVGMAISFWHLRRAEATPESRGRLRAQAGIMAVAIGGLLVVDLFVYRGVPASRIIAAGKMGVGQAIDLASFPGLLRPLGEALNYALLVWHATVLSLLIGGLLLAVTPAFVSRLRGQSFRAHVAGAALAVPQPFCSCCAAPVGSALHRAGASLGPVLAFTVSAPMLNVVTWVLASSLLPPQYALLRIGGGLFVGVLVTYAAARVASRWAAAGLPARPSALAALSARVTGWSGRLFQFDAVLRDGALDSPAALLSRWLRLTWRLGRVVVPMLFLGALVAAALVRALPASANNLTTVGAAAALGTLLMVPSWTEIPIAAGLIQQGITGPAAALLLTLPAVSIPCLIVLAGAVRSVKAVVLLALLVFVVGAAAGTVFLYA